MTKIKKPKKITRSEYEKMIEKNFVEIRRETKEHMALIRKFVENTRKELFKMVHKNNRLTVDIYKTLKRYGENIRSIDKTSINADETLCNVLHAIRQNEYLQAYYPAQKGYPEMKVTGIHPVKINQQVK